MIAFFGLSPAWQQTYRVAALRPGGVLRSSRVRRFASGKATNAAAACRGQADVVALATCVGGAVGSLYEGDLFRLGLRLILARGPETRCCTTVIDDAGATELVEESAPQPPAVAEELLRGVRRLDAAVVCGCGSVPEGAGEDVYARMVRGAGEATTVVDSSGRPLWRACEAGVTVAKPNRSELAATVGRPLESEADVVAAAAELRAAGAAWVLVTDGPRPALLLGEESPRWLPVSDAGPGSPIGAGDVVCGRLAAAVADGSSVSEAAAAALEAGTRHVRAGGGGS